MYLLAVSVRGVNFAPFIRQVELASLHCLTSPPTSLLLHQEAHLLLRAHRFRHGPTDDVTQALLCESAALLGDEYSR